MTHYKREEDPSMKSGKLDELRRMCEMIDHVAPRSMILCIQDFGTSKQDDGVFHAAGTGRCNASRHRWISKRFGFSQPDLYSESKGIHSFFGGSGGRGSLRWVSLPPIGAIRKPKAARIERREAGSQALELLP
jgi:hypothetical protein